MTEIPYYYILDCVKDWTKPAGYCIDCGKHTPSFIRWTEKFLCIHCYRERAKANTLGEVCIATV